MNDCHPKMNQKKSPQPIKFGHQTIQSNRKTTARSKNVPKRMPNVSRAHGTIGICVKERGGSSNRKKSVLNTDRVAASFQASDGRIVARTGKLVGSRADTATQRSKNGQASGVIKERVELAVKEPRFHKHGHEDDVVLQA